jgi:hypothetical protein
VKRILIALFFLSVAHAAPVPCTLTPCSYSANVAWTTAGYPDTRPTTWGNTDAVTTPITFKNVPSGYRVQIVHVSGDQIAAPFNTKEESMPSWGMAYVLISLTNSTGGATSPYVSVGTGVANEGMLYKQSVVPPSGVTRDIDEDITSPLSVLNEDNVLNLNQALFLSTAGVPIHLEATLVVQFLYVEPLREIADGSGVCRQFLAFMPALPSAVQRW